MLYTCCHYKNKWTLLINHPNHFLSGFFFACPCSYLSRVIFFPWCTETLLLFSLFIGFSHCQHDPRNYHFEEKVNNTLSYFVYRKDILSPIPRLDSFPHSADKFALSITWLVSWFSLCRGCASQGRGPG